MTDDLHALARCGEPVLILGEEGTEACAASEDLHRLSGRTGRYVHVPCRELVRDLPTHAFFGTTEGWPRPGHLEHARAGTIFLEEIADLPKEDQRLLLDVLTSGTYRPAGAAEPVELDVRWIASTHRSPSSIVLTGAFEAGLFQHLSRRVTVIPPLRERGANAIEAIARDLADWEPDALRLIPFHAWPGNVRELRAFCARAGDRRITAADVVERLGLPADPQARLWRVLKECKGDVGDAARRLGVSRSTIHRRMAALGIPRGAGRCG